MESWTLSEGATSGGTGEVHARSFAPDEIGSAAVGSAVDGYTNQAQAKMATLTERRPGLQPEGMMMGSHPERPKA